MIINRIPKLAVLIILSIWAHFVIPTAQSKVSSPEGCNPIPQPPLYNILQSLNIDNIKQLLLFYRCTRYDDEVAAVLEEAQWWVRTRAPQVSKPAIVLDIDETSVSNWLRIKRDDFASISNGPCDLSRSEETCGDIAWQQSGLAPALLPTLKLYRSAKCALGPGCISVAVFFVTGRYHSDDAKGWTERNLVNAGYRDWDGLYMRNPGTRGRPGSEHKIMAREDIESKGFTIIANIGDQESDLVGGHAERTFKVPNPFYFNP